MRLLKLLTAPFDMLHARFRPTSYARRAGVKMEGKIAIYGSSYDMFGPEPSLVTLGDNVFISLGARFVSRDEALPFLARRPNLEVAAPIKVGNNCFIGYRAIILPGVTIGNDCLVAAGAYVSADVEPGTVVAGNPARAVMTTQAYLKSALANSTGLGAVTGQPKLDAYKEHFGIKQA